MNVPGEGVPSSTCQSHYVNIDNKKTVEIQTLCVCVGNLEMFECFAHVLRFEKKHRNTHTHNTF